jgi:hypothetical protein
VRRIALLPIVLLATFCAGARSQPPTSVPGHGAIRIEIIPNPIVATKVSGNTYDFPFEVVIREVGGHVVDITRVSADVYALGGIHIADESYDAARINSLGYATRVPANGELRYRFSQRREVPDDRLFGNVTAEIRVEARDDTGAPATASTTVTVKR